MADSTLTELAAALATGSVEVVDDLAREHCTEALGELLRIMREGTNDQARLAAAREILDRGFGKPVQAIVTDEDHEMIRYAVSDQPHG